MRTALIFLAVAFLILIFMWSRTDVWFTDSTVDIHIHDTYFVIARWHFIILIILILGTISSLGGVIGTRFQNKAFIVFFFIFLAVDAFIVWKVYSLFHSST